MVFSLMLFLPSSSLSRFHPNSLLSVLSSMAFSCSNMEYEKVNALESRMRTLIVSGDGQRSCVAGCTIEKNGLKVLYAQERVGQTAPVAPSRPPAVTWAPKPKGFLSDDARNMLTNVQNLVRVYQPLSEWLSTKKALRCLGLPLRIGSCLFQPSRFPRCVAYDCSIKRGISVQS